MCIRDRDYGEPYAGLAETYVQDWFLGAEPALGRAFDLARQAEARDPTLPLVQEALSTVHLFKREHAEAVVSAQRWIALEPSNADAHAALAGALHFAGDNEQVVALIDKAMRLNPYYPFYYPHYAGMANLALRRFDAAVAALKRAIVRNPDAPWPHVFLAACTGIWGSRTWPAISSPKAGGSTRTCRWHRCQSCCRTGTTRTWTSWSTACARRA